ncbi:MAG: MFS transporter [Acidihalobacter sp.]|uniref:MFS transporter n=1 Tax=Acidihalobacter sp. TaxID=1872108 RepID=UPI00307E5F31
MKQKTQTGILLATLPSYVIVILDISIVNVALEALSRAFPSEIGSLQWIISAYTLVFGSLLLFGGYLGDRYSPRRSYSIGLTLFGLGSLLCGLAPSISALIAFRAIQGVGAALLVPNSLALISLGFPEPAERSRAIGLWAGFGGIAMASGPLLGGLLIHYFGWRSVFIVNLPFILAGLVLIQRIDSPAKISSHVPFDLIGLIITVVAVGSTIVLLIDAPSFGWVSWRSLALLTTAVVFWILLPFVEKSRHTPMFPPQLFVKRHFLGGVYVTFISALTFYGLFFLLSLILQRSFDYSPLETGFALLPLTIAVGVGSLMASRTIAWLGERNTVLFCLLLYGAGFFYIQGLGAGTDYFSLAVAFPVIGLAAGAITPATTVVLMSSVEPRQTGVTASIQNASRQVGAALGVAIFGTFLISGYSSSLSLRHASWLILSFVGSALYLWLFAFPSKQLPKSPEER